MSDRAFSIEYVAGVLSALAAREMDVERLRDEITRLRLALEYIGRGNTLDAAAARAEP